MEKKRAYAVATAHLDTVWRWNISETIEKFIPNTLAENFDLMEKFPGYKFNFEGAYRYKLIEHFYPKAFGIMKKYIDEGRWCISGTEYENGDVNIPSPEALMRNILLGDKYFKERFGKSSKDIFLPDCFGFSHALPSVAAHCGLKGFTTQKLSWGSAVELPFDLGRWQGPDGNEIFAAINAGSYRSKFSGDIRGDLGIINRIIQNSNDGNLPWVNHIYGTGDQGGAPDEASVKAVEESVKKNAGDFSVISASSDRIFNDLDKLSHEEKKMLPLWNSELLMTGHGTGCYTSRCMSKRLNRQNEQFALATEKICTLAHIVSGSFHYPDEALNQAWERVIKHQFHDDITGTAINEVYNDAWNDYYLSLSQFKTEYAAAGKAVSNKLRADWIDEKSVAIMVSNPTQYRRNDTVEAVIRSNVNCNAVSVFDSTGKEYPSQLINKNGKALTVVFSAQLEGFESRIFEIRPAEKPCCISTDLKTTNHSLENCKYKLIFNKNGDIAYLYDKVLKRQIIDKPIKMALLRDTGSLAYPSWEITKEDIDRKPYCYANTPEFTVIENGPARSAIKIVRQAENSTITQIVTLDSQSEYINVTNIVDWRTRRSMLKAVFPLAAKNEAATYDLGLGTIKRGNNTDRLYEVPAQKWADITDNSGEFGVSVFSDSKYGWDKPDDNTLRLTCIHTPAGAFTKESRQDLQDLGRNIFSFAIFSHKNGCEDSTQKYSEIYANPLTAITTNQRKLGGKSDSVRLAEISNEDVLIRAIKLSEDGKGVIVRVNEGCSKEHRHITLTLPFEIGEAYQVNGLEEKIKKIKAHDNKIIFNIKPFEVKTFKLVIGKRCDKDATDKYHCLRLPFNSKGFSQCNDEMKHVILQGAGFSLPIEKIPETSLLFNGGIRYVFFQNPNDRFDVCVCRGQSIKLKRGTTRVYFLAASTLGKEKVVFKVDNKEVALTINCVSDNISCWDMAALNQTANVNSDETLGYEFPYTHHPEGIITKKAHFYQYSINTKGSKWIQLPENNKIVIIAATEIAEIAKSELCTKIEDTVPKSYSFEENMTAVDKVLDKADFLTIRAGKIQDQVNNGKGKGFKRDNIITNIIRSYTKSEW